MKKFKFKKLLISVLLLIGLGSCGEESIKDYHGVKYRSSSESVTLPLIAFEDNISRETSGCFVVCIGSYETHERCKYRILVKFPDETMKIIEFRTDDLFIKYGDKCSITTRLYGLKDGLWISEVILEVPEGSVKYENQLDGK